MIECQDCFWVGNSSALVYGEDEIGEKGFYCCPECGSWDFEDAEGEEEKDVMIGLLCGILEAQQVNS